MLLAYASDMPTIHNQNKTRAFGYRKSRPRPFKLHLMQSSTVLCAATYPKTDGAIIK